MTNPEPAAPAEAAAAVPLDVRVEVYKADLLMYAFNRDDLVFAAVPSPGDNLNPIALVTDQTGRPFDTAPRIDHVEHYPTLRNGRALGAAEALGPGACVVVHQQVHHLYSDDTLQALQEAGWHVEDFSTRLRN